MERQDAFSHGRSATPGTGGAGAGGLRLPLLLAAAVIACVELLCATVQPVPGEPLLLRWMRVVADHPVRAGLAFYLLFWSAGPRPVSSPGGEKTTPS